MVIKLNGVAAQEEVRKFKRDQLEEKVHKSKLTRVQIAMQQELQKNHTLKALLDMKSSLKKL